MSEGFRNVLLVSPVGSGKSVMLSHIVHSAYTKGNPVLILTHREELLEQLSNHLNSFDVTHGTIRAGRDIDSSQLVQVASVRTLVGRPIDAIKPPSLIVIDEAHHAIPRSSFGQCILRYPKAARLGVTATPRRLSGEPLSDLFDCMIEGPNTRDLIDMGNLSNYRLFIPSTINTDGVKSMHGDFLKSQLEVRCLDSTIIGDAVEQYVKRCKGSRAVVFCLSVEAAKKTAQHFASAGFPTSHLDGGMSKEERHSVVSGFKEGRVKILTSCEIISEGFDLPSIECAILLRPTQSLSLFIQQCGRALRTFPGKEYAVILDHAGNTMRHGFPCEPREWSLGRYDSKILGNKEKEISIKICTQCFAAIKSGSTSCQYCGFIFPVKPRKLRQEDGDLQEINPRADAERKLQAKKEQAARLLEQRSASSLEDLVLLGKSRGYRYPERWASHIFHARQNAMSKWGKR